MEVDKTHAWSRLTSNLVRQAAHVPHPDDIANPPLLRTQVLDTPRTKGFTAMLAQS